MLLHDIINEANTQVSLQEMREMISLPLITPQLPESLPLAFHRQIFPGPAQGQFDRRLRHTLHAHYHTLLVRLPSSMQTGFLQLYMHAQKTFSLTLRMLRLLDLAETEQTTIALGAFFHDIGKLAIDADLLNKPGRLTPQEYAIIQHHPVYGASILNSYASLPEVAVLAYHHHERWDGEGYPGKLAGEAIPLGARMIAIADAFDAMTSNRSYQVRRTPQAALEELQRCAGTQFDPLLVQLFCAGSLIPVLPASSVQPYPANH